MRDESPKTFNEVFKRNFNVLMSNVHTTLPGVIVEYTGDRICSVKPQIQKKMSTGEYLELPVIEQVPIIFPSGGEFGMSWPLNKGDTVLIMFCERAIEDWLQNGKETQPEDLRRFSLTDAVAIPGLFNKQTTFPASNNEDVQIIYKESSLILKKDGTIEINGNIINSTGTEINLNGDSKAFVTHTELDTALQAFNTTLNSYFTAIAGGATAAIAASGLWTTPLAPVLVPITLDISGSATTTVKTGG